MKIGDISKPFIRNDSILFLKLSDKRFSESKQINEKQLKESLIAPDDVYFLYYPNENEQQLELQNLRSLRKHKSNNSLITLEVPSLKNKLYPTMLKDQDQQKNKNLQKNILMHCQRI